MSIPAIAGLGFFLFVPFLLAIGLSFTNLRLGSPLETEIVGLAQYRRVLENPSFGRAFLNNVLFAGVVVPIQTGFALVLALMLDRAMRGRAIFRTLFFMPVVFPMSLIAIVWELIYAPGPNGMLNAALGWAIEPRDWLRDPWLALPSIMVLSIWQGVGFQMVVLLAGLQSIPKVLYEAAAIDRAGAWSRFRHVTLPQLRNPLVFTGLVTTILAFRVFAQVEILTQGGPNDATTTVIYEAYDTIFHRFQVAMAFAMIVIFFLVVFLITWIQRLLVREEREIA
jgi:multiple sugar transport system permease protein